MINNYVISLESATERREHIKKEFEEKNISFEFFDAISPTVELINIYLPNINKSTLTKGEKGCLLSHFLLWKKCIENNFDYIAIFEDDVILSEDANKFLSQIDWLNERFNTQDNIIIKLETFLQPVKVSESNITSYYNKNFLNLETIHFGTAGYIITYQVAKYLVNILSSMKDNEFKPADWIIFEQMHINSKNKIYQVSPAICVQEQQINRENSKLSSQLEKERKLNIKYTKKTIIEKVIYKLHKPIRIIKKINHLKDKVKIPFYYKGKKYD
ncbi:glycosyltransferase family 25 protein [Otariodibacter oris]|uniref:Glycosyl transferase family 25 n=1 Tax=Otariodibacter oris TaxID=1032623 RepID=A0A420XH76_9PAST|nr:glycosyltransferase family 25 protein [Otariodibacter oris]QGM81271.1 hypothetical protein A6A10_07540 [Otariodibacter oris]RKR72834.1 glycosyl transferase family 25 [Otariodibacter oris]